MTDKIDEFLQEEHLKFSSKGAWGIGTILTRAGAKAALATMSVHSATDQILISANREIVLPIIAEALGKICLTLKDPALFDIPTATFAVLMQQSLLGIKSTAPCLVFVTLKAVSENSTHVLIEGYDKGYFAAGAAAETNRVRDAISARFR